MRFRRRVPAHLRTRATALAIQAAHNEIHALRALNRHDDADLLNAWADEQQRAVFELRPLVHRAKRAGFAPSPGVSAVVNDYRGTE